MLEIETKWPKWKEKTDNRKRPTGDSDTGIISQELCSVSIKNGEFKKKIF